MSGWISVKDRLPADKEKVRIKIRIKSRYTEKRGAAKGEIVERIGEYLCANKIHKRRWCWQGKFEGYRVVDEDHEHVIYFNGALEDEVWVLAWMPLPAPFEESKEA